MPVLDFEKIILTDEELHILKQLNEGTPLLVRSESRKAIAHLKELEFVEYFLADECGTRSAVGKLLHASISDTGKRYLLYLSNREKADRETKQREQEKEKRQFRHDWKIAIFSAIAGAILSRPLWAGIDWAVQLIVSFPGKLP